jgi:hypothetical protein
MSVIVKLCKDLLWALFWMPKTRIWNYWTMSTHGNSKWRNMTTSKWKAFINKMLNIPIPNDWVQRFWISKEVHPVPYHWCFFKAPVSWVHIRMVWNVDDLSLTNFQVPCYLFTAKLGQKTTWSQNHISSTNLIPHWPQLRYLKSILMWLLWWQAR